MVIGIAALHVDDILFAGSTVGWQEFGEILALFGHSDVEVVTEKVSLVYLGLDIGLQNGMYYLSQESFIEHKLKDVPESARSDSRDREVTVEARKTSGKRAVGMMIWLLQSRPDISQKLCALASTINSCSAVHASFTRWCKSANKLMARVRSENFRINSRSIFGKWVPKCTMEFLTGVNLFVFPDASFASINNDGSVESFICVLGKAVSRDGSILCAGNYLDGGCRRIARVRRSSLSADAIGLGNAEDLGVFLRVLAIEVISGWFFKELSGPSRMYKLVSPHLWIRRLLILCCGR